MANIKNKKDCSVKTLQNIVAFLKNDDFSLGKFSRDGRINSAFNEDEIFKILSKKFHINRPNARDWVDFSFEENKQFVPVNIKISKTDTADNLNCKLGIYYALTGKLPHFGNGISWEEYFKNLKENLELNNADYYFLVINKNDLKDIFYTSLKSLAILQPNGNNLPFQAKWSENKTRINRHFNEAKDFILSHFGASLRLRSEAFESFKRYFNEFKY